MIEAGYADFARRWHPILDVFEAEGVRFAHEVHPTEIAYDFWTTAQALAAVQHRAAFGLNSDPSHFVWQDLDPVAFLWEYRDSGARSAAGGSGGHPTPNGKQPTQAGAW